MWVCRQDGALGHPWVMLLQDELSSLSFQIGRASAPCPDQQTLCVWGEKLDERLKDTNVWGKCGWESNRCEEGGKKTRRFSTSCIRNGQTDSVQCEAGSVSHFGGGLISLNPLISQTWLCVVLCLLGRVWKAEDAFDSAVSLESRAQTHWGCMNWQSYSRGATKTTMIQQVQPDADMALLLHSSSLRQKAALLVVGQGKIQSRAGTNSSCSCVDQDGLLHSNAKMNLLYQCQHRVLKQG